MVEPCLKLNAEWDRYAATGDNAAVLALLGRCRRCLESLGLVKAAEGLPPTSRCPAEGEGDCR